MSEQLEKLEGAVVITPEEAEQVSGGANLMPSKVVQPSEARKKLRTRINTDTPDLDNEFYHG